MEQATNITRIEADWMQSYRAELPDEYRKYIAETAYYDYNTSYITSILNDILSTADTEQEAVTAVLNYVFANVEYDYYESDSRCFSATGSKVLQYGKGQCDTQSMAVITLLRGMGISSRSVGGCVFENASCREKLPFFAIIEPKRPKWKSIEYDPEKVSYGRTADGSRAGGLHLWLEYYSVDKKQWIPLESTSGEIIKPDTCYNYAIELYPDQTKNELNSMCVSTDTNFALWCSKQ